MILWASGSQVLGLQGCTTAFPSRVLILLFILCVVVFYLHVYLCTTCVPGTYRGQKRAVDLLEWNGSYCLLATVWALGMKSRLSERASVLLTAEPSLQPQKYFIVFKQVKIIKHIHLLRERERRDRQIDRK